MTAVYTAYHWTHFYPLLLAGFRLSSSHQRINRCHYPSSGPDCKPPQRVCALCLTMGVKSLWSLLTPVGRPVMHVNSSGFVYQTCSRRLSRRLETMEGKVMAIDSSIWLYQFQATMRDKEGNVLNNAHVLGFLRRICKLLFYGIKPVFVFDGGAPVLKRSTLVSS